jgi:hypothetical protein
VTRYMPGDLAKQTTGWSVSDTGFVVVKQPDRFEAMRIVVER